MIRIDKFLVNQGLGTRSEIKTYAKQGKITVNGVVCKKTDIKIDENSDIITFNNQTIKYKEHIYIMLNKKAGYVTANFDNLSKTVFDLIDVKHKNLFAVGRLDKDTEGLLLLTTDGALSHALMSPKRHVSKVYFVKTSTTLSKEHIKIFKDGIIFKDGTKLKPSNLTILSDNTALVEIFEGKFHQVKNMFKVINSQVEYLKRVKIADLELDNTLEIGQYRYLTEDEEKYLKEIIKGENE